ncbi:hypothetical protein K1719_011352 [Acacia pycnantha]|nr:hypothetical protein K1719_011352 [Acacia pycnantha]
MGEMHSRKPSSAKGIHFIKPLKHFDLLIEVSYMCSDVVLYDILGQQAHRSLDDVRMDLEIIKNCAAVLFLKSNFPDVFTENTNKVSSNATMRSCGNIIGKSLVPDGGSYGNHVSITCCESSGL